MEEIEELDIAIAWATVPNRHEELNRESLNNAEEEDHAKRVPPDALKREISEHRSSYQAAEAKARKLAESLRQSTPGVTKTDLRIAVELASIEFTPTAQQMQLG